MYLKKSVEWRIYPLQPAFRKCIAKTGAVLCWVISDHYMVSSTKK